MLISVGETRSAVADRRLAFVLAAVAGALNAAAFRAVGFYSANMTGNVSSLSARLASRDWQMAGFYLAVVLAFIGGAAVSSLLINIGRRRQAPAIYAFSILLEAALLALLGALDLHLGPALRGPVLVLGLSFLMGLQNATVTRISDARIRTTHISGMATDIGIELGMLLDVASGRERDVNPAPYRSRLRLHLQTVLGFLAGGVVGVLFYPKAGGVLLIGAAAVLFGLALNGLVRLHLNRGTTTAGA